MWPIITKFTLTPEGAVLAGIIISALLGAFVVGDGLRTQGRAKLSGLLMQGILLFVVGSIAAVAMPAFVALPDTIEIPITGWGVLTVAGMCTGYLIQRRLAARDDIDREHVFNLWLFGGTCALIGARLLHVVLNWQVVAPRPLSALAFWDGGLVWLGAAIGYAIFIVIYFNKYALPIRLLDHLAIGFALGHGIARVGCFLGGCCWGQPTDAFWGVAFVPESLAFISMVDTQTIEATAAATPHVHPTQLYEAFAEWTIGAVLLYRLHKAARPGTVAALYFILYPLARFTIEVYRDDPDRQFLIGSVSTSQVISLAVLPVALIAMMLLARRAASSGTAAPPPVGRTPTASPGGDSGETLR